MPCRFVPGPLRRLLLRPRMIRGATVMLLLACSHVAVAQQKAPSQEEVNQQLLKRIEELERRLAEYEKKPAVKPAAEPDPEMRQSYPSLKIGGFGDVTYNAQRTGGATGYGLGQSVLHLNSQLSPRINFFGEFSMTARADGGAAPTALGFNPEVERAIVRYDHNDQFKISFGRYHTPVNYWNTAYHHGLWLQTSVARPEMTQFGGRFIPVHFIGALLEGSLPTSGLNLNYAVGFGNGRGAVTSRGGDFADVNNNRALLANFFVKPDRLFGLQVGGSVYRDRVNLATGRRFDETIVSGHVAWLKETPEIIAEFARAHHREIGAANFFGEAYYVQVGYRLPGFNKRLKPYYRFENMRLQLANPVYAGTPGTKGSVVGLRVDLADYVALKTEFRNLRRDGASPFNGVAAQLSFAY